jgi:hypothetical protein
MNLLLSWVVLSFAVWLTSATAPFYLSPGFGLGELVAVWSVWQNNADWRGSGRLGSGLFGVDPFRSAWARRVLRRLGWATGGRLLGWLALLRRLALLRPSLGWGVMGRRLLLLRRGLLLSL